mgnify:CR=1 FL=1
MIIENKQPKKKGAKRSWSAVGTKSNMPPGLTEQHLAAISEVFFRCSGLAMAVFGFVYFSLHFFVPQVFN